VEILIAEDDSFFRRLLHQLLGTVEKISAATRG
jgi:hypothetical protein